MGGGQAEAPADDDHVPWSRPPRHGHSDLACHGASRPGRAGPDDARIPDPGIYVEESGDVRHVLPNSVEARRKGSAHVGRARETLEAYEKHC